MAQQTTYALACAFDEEFALPAAVALRSASMHWSRPTRLDVYIIDGGVTPQSRSRIEESIFSSRMQLHWCSIAVEDFRDLPLFAGRKESIYHRLAIGDVVPAGIHRLIWLDMDVLVLRCLSTLGEIELEGKALAAVQDMAIPLVSSPLGLAEFEALGLKPDTPYFNSGIMLIDLRLWREQDMRGQLLAYLRTHADRIFLFDQHAFNALYAGHWLPLDPRWNVIASLAGDRNTNDSDLPWILHYAGAFKPWKVPLRGPVFNRYRQVLREIAMPVPGPGLYERILAVYFRYFRTLLYPLERLCWVLRHRLLRS